jgi:hypothetical protein
VRSRNGRTFDEIAETAREEENAIYWKNEKNRQVLLLRPNFKGIFFVMKWIYCLSMFVFYLHL